jgi:hypothetical protein
MGGADAVADDQFLEGFFYTQLKVDAVCKLVTASRLSSGLGPPCSGCRRAFFDLLRLYLLWWTTRGDLAQDLQTLDALAASRRTAE